jgi:5'-nucleotidase
VSPTTPASTTPPTTGGSGNVTVTKPVAVPVTKPVKTTTGQGAGATKATPAKALPFTGSNT